MSRPAILLGAALLALAAGCGGTTTVTVSRTVTHQVTVTTTATTTAAPAPCGGNALSGTFAVVPGSAGAGQVSYRLRLANGSGTACTLSGLPAVELRDGSGTLLPTHVRPSEPGQATAPLVTLAPGKAATADARFSPDVPGPTEQHPGACEPTAHVLRVTAPGGGSVDVPVEPPTSVCEQGSLELSVFTAG